MTEHNMNQGPCAEATEKHCQQEEQQQQGHHPPQRRKSGSRQLSIVLIISLSTICISFSSLLTPVHGSSPSSPSGPQPPLTPLHLQQQLPAPASHPPAHPQVISSSVSKPSWRLPSKASSSPEQTLMKRKESTDGGDSSSGAEAPLYALVKRHFPLAYHDHFQFKLQSGLVATDTTSNIHDTFRISSNNSSSSKETIQIEGASLSALGAGLNYYLRNVCQVEMSWSGDRFDQIPAVPPRWTNNSNSGDGGPVVRASFVPWRYYMNVVTFGYSFAFWDWSRWERELDWMMLNGVNMALAMVGQEYVVRKFYEDQGLTRDQINEFLSGPAFMPWQRMGNIQGSWGFGNDTVYKNDWIDSQWELQGQIIRRMQDFNITAIMPSFNGFVPQTLPSKYPTAKFENASQWASMDPYSRVTFIPTTDPLFVDLSKRFIELQSSMYQTAGYLDASRPTPSHHYLLDLYNELNPNCMREDYLQKTTSSVMKALKAADPDAIWVMQGWFLLHRDIWRPAQTKAFFDGIRETNNGRDAFVIDLYSDIAPLWNSTEGFFGIDWGWSMLNNFGGGQALYGTLPTLLSEPFRAYHQPARTMKGMGITMEGINNNEYLYQLILDLPWESVEATYPLALNTPALISKGVIPPPNQPPVANSVIPSIPNAKNGEAVLLNQGPLDSQKHLDDFIRRRYGPNQTSEAMLHSWKILSQTVWDVRSGQMSQSKSILDITPALDMNRQGFMATVFWYNKPAVIQAWSQLIESTQTEASKARRGHGVIQNALQDLFTAVATGSSNNSKRSRNSVTTLWTSFSGQIRDAFRNTLGQRQQKTISAPLAFVKRTPTPPPLPPIIQAGLDPTPLARLPTEEELPLNISSFRYDIVDVTREIMAAIVIPGLHREFVAAYRSKNLAMTRSLGNGLLEAILDTDRILATHSHFMVGPWIRDARVSAKVVGGIKGNVTKADELEDTYADYLEYNARNLVTWWGPKGQAGLADYASKEWAGIVKEFYYPRWKIFVDRVITAVQEGKSLDYKGYLAESLSVESVWQKEATCLGGGCLLKEAAQMRKDRVEKYSVDAVGDTIETAQDLWDRWGQVALRLSQDPAA